MAISLLKGQITEQVLAYVFTSW